MISSFYERIVGGSQQPVQRRILCVGLTCLDIVQTCDEFPTEDTDRRCTEYRWQRGGNASNSCTVLSLLGSPCEFLGTLSTGEHLNFLRNDMRKYGIDCSHCPMVDGIGCPTSTVILSLSTGSRTILHYNPDLPELTLGNFEQLQLDDYSWIHFEGRNLNEVLSMVQHVESHNNRLESEEEEDPEKKSSERMPITISVELERPKSELLDLLPYVDVAFISKDFAQGRGYDNMSETLRCIGEESKSGATIICAWSDRGAMARTPDNVTVQSPAFSPAKVVDTLGAGDTFNAAVLHYLNKAKLEFTRNTTNEDESSGAPHRDGSKRRIKRNRNIESQECCDTEFIDQNTLQSAITFGCRVAGAKVGLKGYDGLNQLFNEAPEKSNQS